MNIVLNYKWNGFHRKKKLFTLMCCFNRNIYSINTQKIKINTPTVINKMISYKGILYTHYNLRKIYYFLYEQYNIIDNLEKWIYKPESILSHSYNHLLTNYNIKWSYLYFKGIVKCSGLHYLQLKLNENVNLNSCYIGLTSNTPNIKNKNYYRYLNKNTYLITDNGIIIKDGNIIKSLNIDTLVYIKLIYNSYTNELFIYHKSAIHKSYKCIYETNITFKSSNLTYPFICFINNSPQKIEFINNIQ